ncbi:hypothetical protein P43SY_001643 [Pythium insidiosum]|uniref:Uncharacterized protein n=1 Tax=Pythium insidiosum TaxID=114742 RepID=A0AAD5QAQ8_PYTIN|nr:hypothetical protein P43SY_001643 [Pythium insidiosum]
MTMMMTSNTTMIATGAERSVAQLRLIFERASAKTDICAATETVEANETRVADLTTTELEPQPASESEPERENDGNNESMSDSESDSEIVHVLHDHEMRSIINDDVQESEPPKNEIGSVSETQSHDVSDVAMAPHCHCHYRRSAIGIANGIKDPRYVAPLEREYNIYLLTCQSFVADSSIHV